MATRADPQPAPIATESRDEPTLAPPEKPRFFYGWVMAGVCTVAFIATAPGQTLIVSQFNESFTTSLGLSATMLSTAYLVGTVLAASPLVLVGRASDRIGPRRVMLAVAVLFGLACVFAGQARGVVMLTVAFFLLRFLGQGSLALTSGHALALWFERRLGTVNAMKLVGTQLGFAAFAPLAAFLIAEVGWRTAYALLGLLVWILVLPMGLLLSRDHPEQMGQRIDGDPPHASEDSGGEAGDEMGDKPRSEPRYDPAFTLRAAVRTPAYWILALSSVMNGLIGTALIFHAQPMLAEAGLDPEASAALVMAWSITMAVAVLPAGWLADRVHPRILLSLAALLLAAAATLFLSLGSVAIGVLAMACFGVSQAAATAAGVPTVARYFGRAHHGAIRGSVTRLAVAGTGLGPIVLGVSIDELGSFRPGMLVFVAASVALGAWCSRLERPAPPHAAE
ncbi:MAG: MFS transporter [Planctomycetota bacterium]